MSNPALPAPLSDAVILIVDDEQPNVILLSRLLARVGFRHVHATTDPHQALPLFREHSPDLLLLDVRMPGLDGFDVLAQLREVVPPTDYLPILAITGDASPETRRRVISAGAKDFLEKPFDAAEVVVRVENLLTTRMLHRSLQRQNGSLEQMVRERTAELESALAAAEAASLAKSQFLATMSHELRTPLNAVIGFSQQLMKNKGKNLRPTDVAFVERISENGTHLLQLINDILDLSRIEAGKMSVERAPIDLEQLVTDVVAQNAPDASRAPVTIQALVPVGVRPLLGDAEKLGRVLNNLVGNAVKFTERGQVNVAVVVDAGAQAQRIDVVDTGIGIPSNRLDAVFERFEQADNSTQRRFGGTGLGLTISKTLCDLLGYRLTVVSDPGVGSAFSILLEPAVRAPASYVEVVTNLENMGSMAS